MKTPPAVCYKITRGKRSMWTKVLWSTLYHLGQHTKCFCVGKNSFANYSEHINHTVMFGGDGIILRNPVLQKKAGKLDGNKYTLIHTHTEVRVHFPSRQ